MEQCHSLADSCLYRVRIKVFTPVPSANAKLGQPIFSQCLDRNFAVSPNHTCACWWLLPCKTRSHVGIQAASPRPLPAGEVHLLGGCERAGSSC